MLISLKSFDFQTPIGFSCSLVSFREGVFRGGFARKNFQFKVFGFFLCARIRIAPHMPQKRLKITCFAYTNEISFYEKKKNLLSKSLPADFLTYGGLCK